MASPEHAQTHPASSAPSTQPQPPTQQHDPSMNISIDIGALPHRPRLPQFAPSAFALPRRSTRVLRSSRHANGVTVPASPASSSFEFQRTLTGEAMSLTRQHSAMASSSSVPGSVLGSPSSEGHTPLGKHARGEPFGEVLTITLDQHPAQRGNHWTHHLQQQSQLASLQQQHLLNPIIHSSQDHIRSAKHRSCELPLRRIDRDSVIAVQDRFNNASTMRARDSSMMDSTIIPAVLPVPNTAAQLESTQSSTIPRTDPASLHDPHIAADVQQISQPGGVSPMQHQHAMRRLQSPAGPLVISLGEESRDYATNRRRSADTAAAAAIGHATSHVAGIDRLVPSLIALGHLPRMRRSRSTSTMAGSSEGTSSGMTPLNDEYFTRPVVVSSSRSVMDHRLASRQARHSVVTAAAQSDDAIFRAQPIGHVIALDDEQPGAPDAAVASQAVDDRSDSRRSSADVDPTVFVMPVSPPPSECRSDDRLLFQLSRNRTGSVHSGALSNGYSSGSFGSPAARRRSAESVHSNSHAASARLAFDSGRTHPAYNDTGGSYLLTPMSPEGNTDRSSFRSEPAAGAIIAEASHQQMAFGDERKRARSDDDDDDADADPVAERTDAVAESEGESAHLLQSETLRTRALLASWKHHRSRALAASSAHQGRDNHMTVSTPAGAGNTASSSSALRLRRCGSKTNSNSTSSSGGGRASSNSMYAQAAQESLRQIEASLTLQGCSALADVSVTGNIDGAVATVTGISSTLDLTDGTLSNQAPNSASVSVSLCTVSASQPMTGVVLQASPSAITATQGALIHNQSHGMLHGHSTGATATSMLCSPWPSWSTAAAVSTIAPPSSTPPVVRASAQWMSSNIPSAGSSSMFQDTGRHEASSSVGITLDTLHSDLLNVAMRFLPISTVVRVLPLVNKRLRDWTRHSYAPVSYTPSLCASVAAYRSIPLVNDRFLSRIARFNSITYADLGWCQHITDDGVRVVAQSLRKLSTLGLCGLPKVTDAAFESIATLPELRCLILDGVDRLTDVAFDHLARGQCRDSLCELSVSFCQHITDQGVFKMTELANLSCLDLSYTYITDAAMTALPKLQNLSSLDLTWCPRITAKSLPHIARLTGLVTLQVNNCEWLNGSPSESPASPHSDEGVHPAERSLQIIRTLPKLRTLGLHGSLTHLPSAIGQLTQVRSLNLGMCRLNDDDLRCLSSLAELTELNLSSNNQLTEEGLSALKPLTKLRRLVLRHINADRVSGLTLKTAFPMVADASRKFVGLHLGRHQLAPMGYAAAQHPSSAREAVLGALGQGAQALGVSTSGPMMLKEITHQARSLGVHSHKVVADDAGLTMQHIHQATENYFNRPTSRHTLLSPSIERFARADAETRLADLMSQCGTHDVPTVTVRATPSDAAALSASSMSCLDGSAKELALRLLAARINALHAASDGACSAVRILVENGPSPAFCAPATPAEFASLFQMITDKSRVGICLNTAHLAQAGHRMASRTDMAAYITSLERAVGEGHISAVYVSDFKYESSNEIADCSSNLDLSRGITTSRSRTSAVSVPVGDGLVGLDALSFLMNDRRFDHVPMLVLPSYRGSNIFPRSSRSKHSSLHQTSEDPKEVELMYSLLESRMVQPVLRLRAYRRRWWI